MKHMAQWDQELGLDYDYKDWEACWQNMRKCSVSLSVRETAVKLFTRWYLTPLRLSKIFPQSSPLCFRGCPHQGSFLHLFWERAKLRSTWEEVLVLMAKLAGGSMALTHTHCLLFESIPDTPKPLMRLLHTICVAVQWTIALHWKSSVVPLAQIVARVDQIMLTEKIHHTLRDTMHLHDAKWSPWFLHRIMEQS